MDAQTLKALAEEHCKAFAAVPQEKLPLEETAGRWASFFSTPFFAMDPEKNITYDDDKETKSQMTLWLKTMKDVGIPLTENNMQFKNIKVQVHSPYTAWCWMTNAFTPSPETGIEPFEFEVWYAYRVKPGQSKGGFAAANMENQTKAFLDRFPKFFEAATAPHDPRVEEKKY